MQRPVRAWTMAASLVGLAGAGAWTRPALAEPAAEPVGPEFDTDSAMAQHAEPVADYTLRAVLDPVTHRVTAEGTVGWQNRSRLPQRELWLHLYLNAFAHERTVFQRFSGEGFRGQGGLSTRGKLQLQRLTLLGSKGDTELWPEADKTSPGDPNDATDVRVPLPQPVEPGERITLAVVFEAQLPALSFRTGFFGAFHMVAQWFPKLARLEPDGHWAHFPFHRLSEFYADFGTYDVTLDTPAEVVVGATGQLVSEKRVGARLERRFVQSDVHDFAFTAWDRFEEQSVRTGDGVAVRVLYPPGFERVARIELDAALFGLSHFGRAYGRYPYATLTLVHPPAGAEEAGGMEYPTLIGTGGPWFAPRAAVPFATMLTLHELAHQWFYGLCASNEHAYPFLDEGVTSYAEADAMEQLYPGASAAQLFGFRASLAAYQRLQANAVAANAPVAQPASAFVTGSDYAGLVYARTATLLLTLSNVYGPALVRQAIGRYARRYRFAHPGPEALLGAVRDVVGEHAAAQLRAGLYDQATVDYLVSRVHDEPERTDGARGHVLVRRRGTLQFPVEVELWGADGTAERVRWDGLGSSVQLDYHGKSPLVGAVVDPEHRVLLDTDLGNNAQQRRSPRRVSAALLDRVGFLASVLFGAVSP